MHCCIITTVHPPFDNRIFHKQARSLVKAGYRVTLIAQHDRHEVVNDVEIIPLSKSHNRMLRMLRTVIAFRLALKQKADVYHFHDPELIPVCLILKLLGKRVIYDVHEDYPSQIITKHWIPSILRKPLSILMNIVERIGARVFDGIVVVSDSHKERFPEEKRVVISNFPSLEYFKELMKPREIQSELPVAIYTGLLSRKRGIKQVVEAFSLLKGVELWLVGRFDERSFQEEIEPSISSNVKIWGLKPFEEVVKLLKGANIGISCLLPLPIYLNTLPTKILEYMAAGIPIVASDFPFYRDFVDGCGLLVNPLDPEDIARAVRQLLDNPELMQDMGKEGQRRVKEIYNWEQESQKLLSFYRRIGV
jgi:glycosyltransferase involved in cell wall biosynthesis